MTRSAWGREQRNDVDIHQDRVQRFQGDAHPMLLRDPGQFPILAHRRLVSLMVVPLRRRAGNGDQGGAGKVLAKERDAPGHAAHALAGQGGLGTRLIRE